MQNYSVNKVGVQMAKDAMARPDELQIRWWRAECGATLIDMGITCPGSWKAGQVFVESGMGGLGRATYGTFDLSPFLLPSIEVWDDHPVIAEVASRASAWVLERGEFAPVAGGPARAAALLDRRAVSGYVDHAEEVLVQLHTSRIPSDELCLKVADGCHVRPEQVYVMFASSASLVGAIQVAARTTEQTMIKLHVHGFDIHSVRHAFGIAPVAPLIRDELQAMGWINDCLNYGGTTVVYADAPDDAIQPVIERLCFDANAGELWNLPFVEIFNHFGRNWHDVPPLIDSPAKVIINSLQTGHSFVGGQINYDLLRRSFFGAGAVSSDRT